jgi:hypothetical protein
LLSATSSLKRSQKDEVKSNKRFCQVDIFFMFCGTNSALQRTDCKC